MRLLARSGAEWRMLPHDFPRWEAVYQQTRRSPDVAVFEANVHNLRTLLRVAEGRTGQPWAAIPDSRTLQSSPEGGGPAGYDRHKRCKGRKVHLAVDTLGHLLSAVDVTTTEQNRARIDELAAARHWLVSAPVL